MSGTERSSDKTSCPRWVRTLLCASAVSLWILVPGSQTGRPATTVRTRASPQIESEIPTLAPGTSAERELSTGTIHRYRLQLQAGDYVRVAIDQQAIDVGARLVRTRRHACHRRQLQASGQEISIRNRCDFWKLSAGHSAVLKHQRPRVRYVAMIDQQRPAAPKDSQRVLAERVFAEAEALRSEGRSVATTAALDRYRRAFDLWTTAEDRKGQALAKRRLGEALHVLGRSDDALAALLDSLSISRVAADSEAESAALAGAASVYLDLGRMEDADRFSQAGARSQPENARSPGRGSGAEHMRRCRYVQRT